MDTLIDVDIQNLELDVENPRLPPAEAGQPWSQPRILDYLAEHRNSRGLASTIAREGMLNPSKRLIVMKAEGQRKYIVLEGNRRLAALKLLNNPQLAPTEALRATYRKIAKSAARLPQEAACFVVKNRKEAEPWISMEHASGDEGATVKWEAMEKERFAELMTGGKTRHKKAMKLAEMLQKSGNISASEFKKIPITSFDRLLSDPYVRGRLGADKNPKDLSDRNIQAATRIAKELAHGTIKVDDIKKKEHRKSYIDAVMKNPGKAVEPREGDKRSIQARSGGSGKKTQRSAWQRATLIPAEFKPKIKNSKLREMYKELRSLHVEDTPNACAMLFRAFFEMAIYDYMKRNSISTRKDNKDLTSNQCLAAVKAHLEGAKKLEASVIKPINIALNNPSHFMSVQTLHSYVHEPFVFPEKRQLNEAWQSYEPFMQLILE